MLPCLHLQVIRVVTVHLIICTVSLAGLQSLHSTCVCDSGPPILFSQLRHASVARGRSCYRRCTGATTRCCSPRAMRLGACLCWRAWPAGSPALPLSASVCRPSRSTASMPSSPTRRFAPPPFYEVSQQGRMPLISESA